MRVHHAALDDQFSKNLAGLLSLHQEPKRTGCPVIIDYCTNGATAELQLGDQWRVKPSDELLDGLRAQFGSDRVGLDYHQQSGGG